MVNRCEGWYAALPDLREEAALPTLISTVIDGTPSESHVTVSPRNIAIIAMRPLAAIVGGVLLAASFPPIGASWLAPIAVALLTLSTVTTHEFAARVAGNGRRPCVLPGSACLDRCAWAGRMAASRYVLCAVASRQVP